MMDLESEVDAKDPCDYNLTELSRASQDCIKSLAFPEMNVGLYSVHTAAKGTCQWLFRHERYLDWVAHPQSLLWINGKPGTGKSTLIKYVLENDQNVSRVGTRDILLFFFFSRHGVELQRTPLGLYRSLLYQTLKQIPDVLPDLISTFDQRRKESGEPGEAWQWRPEELQTFFQSSLPEILKTRRVWLFIDSLDACGQENAANFTRIFKDLVHILSSGGFRGFHVCLTCHSHLNLEPDSTLQLCLENENQGDIALYIQSHVSASFRTDISYLTALIAANAKDIFTLIRLLVNQVLEFEQKGIRLAAIEEKMNSIYPILELYHIFIERRGSLSWSLETLDKVIIQLLADDDAEIFFKNAWGGTPLSWAAAYGHEEGVNLLLNSGNADPDARDARGQTPLSCAAENGHEAIVQLLLNTGKVDPDARDERGRRPLSCAAERGHEAVVKLLLNTGKVSVDAGDAQGRTPLSWAAAIGHETVVNLLLNSGRVDPDARDERGQTPLMRAASNGHAGAVILLFNSGKVDLDAKGQWGQTPLLSAAANGHEAVVKLLLDSGKVDLNTRDDSGRTPLLWAAENGRDAVVKLLQRHL